MSATGLKIIVACQKCKMQFDATKRPIGALFHCVCGELLEVPEPKSHNAVVVRCSSCGGPRHDQESACVFCSSDFTLHEQDLHTVCPQCMARISDRAKYCHYCATPIAPQASAGEETQFLCPACEGKKTLVSRSFGEQQHVIALECDKCGGLWLDNKIFDLVESRAIEEASSGFNKQFKLSPPSNSPQSGPFYRRCPRCKDQMQRRNYGRKSGVIVDSCLLHGIWFDLGELDTILRWVKSGGLKHAQTRIKQSEAHDARLRSLESNISQPSDRLGYYTDTSDKSLLIGGILGFFFGNF